MTLGSDYQRFVNKTDSYTLQVIDDGVSFVIPGVKNATLPKAGACRGGQGLKQIINDVTSLADLTIVAQAGDTLVGSVTVQSGQAALVRSDGGSTWYISTVTGAPGAKGDTGSGDTGTGGDTGTAGDTGAQGDTGP